jgi:hypothetical protein
MDYFSTGNYGKKVSSDGHQFHQYQQNEQSPLTEHKKDCDI